MTGEMTRLCLGEPIGAKRGLERLEVKSLPRIHLGFF